MKEAGLEIEKPLDREHLERYFQGGCKAPGGEKVGVEWEKIGVFRADGRAIPYSGPRGVQAIFRELERAFDWEAEEVGGLPIALRKNGASITLEPGGQIELSGQKADSILANAEELKEHLFQMKRVSDAMDIVWLGLGVQPFSTEKEIEWVPKPRYTIMKETLKDKGRLAHAMMKETASVQISLDYVDEADATEKLRLGMALAPVLTALFGNSPLRGGRLGPYLSHRAHIWQNTAPERTGLIRGVFEGRFGFREYVEFALAVPMLFIVRDGQWIPLRGLTFSEFMKRGFGDYKATLSDWELHLTSLFTETRLKTYLEVRSIDCQSVPLALAAVAFLKGLFYETGARRQAWAVLEGFSQNERIILGERAAQEGLKAKAGRAGTLREIAMRLLEISEAGLRRREKESAPFREEISFLEPLKTRLRKGMENPAGELVQRLAKVPEKRWKDEILNACALT